MFCKRRANGGLPNGLHEMFGLRNDWRSVEPRFVSFSNRPYAELSPQVSNSFPSKIPVLRRRWSRFLDRLAKPEPGSYPAVEKVK